MSGEPSTKRRATESPDGSVSSTDARVAVELSDHRRKQLMRQINFVEHMPDQPEPEFQSEDGETYDENEDLINMCIEDINHETVSDPTGNRIFIKDIFVENFKSYKGRHQLGPLHKNLTMVVGPNGSGKSNVIDALLFVFGFRAKKIRTTKLSSLVYNLDNDCDHALVEIQFQAIKDISREKYECNIANTFNIARSIHKNGVSQYFLCGVATSQKRIQELLTKAGIDMNHNRFLILQGEVEAISQMKPTSKNSGDGGGGMLEYIEDIVGTDRYCTPIAKLAHRCRVLEYKVSQHATQCRRHQEMAEDFRASLQGSIAYINARNNLTMINGITAKHTLEGLKVNLQGCELATRERKIELDRVTERYEGVKGEMKTAEKEKRLIMDELAGMETQKLDYTNHINDWHRMDRTLKNNCKTTLQALKDIIKEIDIVKAEIDALKDAPERHKNRLENMNLESDQLHNQKANLDRVYTQMLAKYDQKVTLERQNLEKLNADVDAMAQHYNVQQEQLLVAENELKEMRVTDPNDLKGADEMKAELETLSKELEKHRASYARLKRELDGFQEKVDTGLANKVEAEKLFNEAFKNEQKLRDELQHYSRMDVDNSYQKRATHALQKLQHEGKFPGFIGRMGDMCYCNKKYDAAISTVFGNQLDWHLVDSKDDCSFAIDYLRQERLPRSTFFFKDYAVSDSSKNRAAMNKGSDPFPAPRLFDQISCDTDLVRRSLYRMLGDILIVETAEDAIRLHRKQRGQYRYTTFDGTFVDWNGSLSGGGKPITGRIRLSKKKPISYINQQVEIDRVNRELETVMKQLEESEKKVAEANGLIDENRDYVNVYSQRAKKLREKIAELENRGMMLENLIPSAEERKRRVTRVITEKDREDKQKEIEDLRTTFENLIVAMEEKKQERDRVDHVVNSMFDQMVGVNKEKLRTIAAQIQGLEAEMAKERVNYNNLPQHTASLKTKLEELEKTCEDKRVDHDRAVAADPAERQDLLQELMNQLENIRHVLDSRTQELDEIKHAIGELETELATAFENYDRADVLYQHTVTTQNGVEANIHKNEQILLQIPNQWCRAEELDPDAEFVSLDDPELNEKLSQGYYIMPEEVIKGVTHAYQQKFMEVDANIVAPQLMQDWKHTKKVLERNTELFRIDHDEKGITHFAALISIQMSEVTMYNKAAEMLRAHRAKLAELRAIRFNEFNKALVFLSTTTQLLYSLITNGGDASLKFVEEGRSDDPFVGGIKFSVRPAKKSWKLIENLSGGEKTLASLCFVFAMHHYRPTPLYVMDEIDAALDLNNVSLIAQYIKTSERTRNAQFIIISLRNQMFEVGNRLVGIYKTDGSTKNIIINPELIEKRSKAAQKMIAEKLKEMAGQQQRAPSEEDERLTQEMSMVKIAPKIQRRLGTLRLEQFGIETSPAPESVAERRQTRRSSTSRSQTPTSSRQRSPPVSSGPTASDDEFYEDGEDRQPRKKAKKKVTEEEEEGQEEEGSPPPQAHGKYPRPTPTLEIGYEKRRRQV